MGSGTGYSVKLMKLDKLLWLEDKTEANAVFSSEHPDHHTWVYILKSTSDVAWVTSSSAARVMRIGRNMIEKIVDDEEIIWISIDTPAKSFLSQDFSSRP